MTTDGDDRKACGEPIIGTPTITDEELWQTYKTGYESQANKIGANGDTRHTAGLAAVQQAVIKEQTKT